MSDDEVYYDSGDDDYFDVLYNADPAPELADDLAERATYSPVWNDNHADELRNYFSDHEYWTDDYWDDDPNLLNSITGKGRPSQSNGEGSKRSAKRGRKRKLSEARDRPALIQQETQSLQATIRGTVWKAKSPQLEEDYKRGSDLPVALRLNDSIMQSAYSTKQGFGMGRRKKDESWANDLSLADMGLRTERSMSTQQNAPMDEEEQDEENEEDGKDLPNDAEKIAMEENNMLDGDEEAAALLVGRACSPEIEISIVPSKAQTAVKDKGEDQPSRKKRKVAANTNGGKEHVLPKRDASLASEVSKPTTEAGKNSALQPATRGRVSLEKSSPEGPGQPKVSNGEVVEAKATTGRKRKASVDSSAITSTASSRAKRVASERLTANSDTAPKQNESVRTTRSRRK
ncbi:hypothetical protein H2198_008462 [Neophaeococcomyces mojaviensis]|uniref:Uncharacterized protein n=1 Tax=Neophaeococcomyces mojaviensis TaxID=3383035 RepID=A0ACC2ZXE3_9EURO|nr:hypothetical protein H2198_008462 [Knufia sp. JES_112]